MKYLSVVLFFFFFIGCLPNDKIEHEYEIEGEKFEIKGMNKVLEQNMVESSELNIPYEDGILILDTLNNSSLKIDYSLAKNDGFEFKDNRSNMSDWFMFYVPHDCGYIIDKRKYQHGKGYVIESSVVSEGVIFFSKVISIQTIKKGIFTITYSSNYLREEFTMSEILIENAFMDNLKIDFEKGKF